MNLDRVHFYASKLFAMQDETRSLSYSEIEAVMMELAKEYSGDKEADSSSAGS